MDSSRISGMAPENGEVGAGQARRRLSLGEEGYSSEGRSAVALERDRAGDSTTPERPSRALWAPSASVATDRVEAAPRTCTLRHLGFAAPVCYALYAR